MVDNYYDVIVVGLGISGGWVVKELIEKGLKVLMLECGCNIEYVKDYVNVMKEVWDFLYCNCLMQVMKVVFLVLMCDYGLVENLEGMWVNEQDLFYIEIKCFDWFRGYYVGGCLLLWGWQSYCFFDLDFEVNFKDGIVIDWLICYVDIVLWYDYVEKFVGIVGMCEGLDVLLDGEFLLLILLNIVEKDVVVWIKKVFGGICYMIYLCIVNIIQLMFEQGCVNCQYCNKCILGCFFGVYFLIQLVMLLVVMKIGNLILWLFLIVKEVFYDKDCKCVCGVEVIDVEIGQIYQYMVKVIFFNVLFFNLIWLLMNLVIDVWDGGLGFLLGEFGYNVMDYYFGVGVLGWVEGYEDKYYFGCCFCGFYISWFCNVVVDKCGYLCGFGYQGGVSCIGWLCEIVELNIGVDLKEVLIVLGDWCIGMIGFGEMLLYYDNVICLDWVCKDKWGLLVLVMDVFMCVNELVMCKDMVVDVVEMLEVVGVKDVKMYDNDYVLGKGIYEMGIVCMGCDWKSLVLNVYNQVWDVFNVYVIDGVCMIFSVCVNLLLIYMVLIVCVVDYVVCELKVGNL